MDEVKFKDERGKTKVKPSGDDSKFKSKMSTPNSLNRDIASPVPSASTVKTKKASKLLSAFVRRNKKKNKQSEVTLNNSKDLSQNLEYMTSTSSLGFRTDEDDTDLVNAPIKNFDMDHVILKATDSENSVQSAPKGKGHFLRKLIKKHSSDNIKKKSEHDFTKHSIKDSTSDSKGSCKICHNDSNRDFTRSDYNYAHAPTSYINFGKSTLNVTLATGLQSVQELAKRFRESEKHLVQLLGKYIKDPNCQKELNETLSKHSRLQREAERRTTALANDMWMHQIEIGRTQEKALQETLNSLVKQNRQLQIDNEVMFRKHEALLKKLRSSDIGTKHKCMDCSSQIECVIKHNETLQDNLHAYVQQIEHLENELQILEKQNERMEDQLRHSTLHTNNLKSIHQRAKTDYELELVTLNFELQKKEEHIKEGFETGQSLFMDLDNLKKQFNGLSVSINWSKFEVLNNHSVGKYLSNIITTARFCINELSKELLSLHSQLSKKNQEMERLQETNTKLQENLKKSVTELDNLCKKMDENNNHETNKIIAEEKCKILESDLKAAQEKIENLKIKFELEKSASVNPDFEKLSKQLAEKDRMIEHTKMFITNITAENFSLRSQVETLNRTMSESGAGDIIKELANCQEQQAYLQSQYYHLLNEKQMYLTEMENMKEERNAIVAQLEANIKQVRKQTQEIETKNDEINGFKKQYESEHQTVLSLQHERMKYLEEKNMLKSVFQHMKAEIARVQKLESAVADISKEASKLAIIAEYNKNIGEKLKTEVNEKEQTILQLRTSVEKLNDIQIQNTKEKLSLCYELSEVCQMKEQLNSILSLEVQRNVDLDDKKKQMFESASTQLKKYEEIYRNEHSVLKDLVQDHNSLMNQNDNLLKENEKLQKEINHFKNELENQMQRNESIASMKNEKERQIADLITKEKENASVVNTLHEKLTQESIKYDSHTKQLEKLIRQLRKEKEQLEGSVKYLQNNIQKLQNDLDKSRENEKETKDLLNKTILEQYELQKNVTQSAEHKEKLTQEISYLNNLCEKVLTDFEASIKSSVEKEEIFKKELNQAKMIIFNNSREIDDLTETVLMKQNEIERLVMEIRELRDRENRLSESVKSFEIQNEEIRDIEQRKRQLELEISNLRCEHDSSKKLLEDVRKEIECMQNELGHIKDQKDEDYLVYKKHLDDVLREHEQTNEASKKEISELKANLNDITQKLENERSAYGTLSEIHKEVSAKFIKSIKNFSDEKTAKQEAESKLKEAMRTLDVMNVEKEDLQHQINILLDGLNEEKNRINSLTHEKNTTQEALNNLQEKYNELLTKCLSLEHQLRGLELGVSTDSNHELYLREHVELLHKDSKENHEQILSLKENITKFQQQITGLEFQKSEMTLRLHEMQRKCETEQFLCEQMKNTQKLIFGALYKLREDGKLDSEDCNNIFRVAKTTG